MIDKYVANDPYPCHPCMFVTENYYSKFTIISFWAPALSSLAENSIPKKSLDTSLISKEKKVKSDIYWELLLHYKKIYKITIEKKPFSSKK